MKIKKSDVDRMIKEEFQKMMEKKKLSTRLSQINEELGKMGSEDSALNEVEADGKTTVASHGWTGEENGDVKFKPKFEKIGSSLKEDDDMPGEEIAAGEEAQGSEMPGASEETPMAEETPMGEFEAKFAEIGKAIDAKLASEAGETAIAGPGQEMGSGDSDEDFEEVEVSPEGESKGEEIEETAQAVASPISADQHLSPEKAEKIDEPTNNLKGNVQQESVEEPLEGESVAQMTDADKVNDNMEKDKHVKEGTAKAGSVITEVKAADTKKNIFTEGIDEKKKTAMLEEFNRMKKFAGLSKDEE